MAGQGSSADEPRTVRVGLWVGVVAVWLTGALGAWWVGSGAPWDAASAVGLEAPPVRVRPLFTDRPQPLTEESPEDDDKPSAGPPTSVDASNSLRGTEVDGDWGVDRWGQLRPALALRRRFDYFLQRQGEVPLPAITAEVDGRARQDLPAAAAAAVMDVWRHYLQLQSTVFKTVANPSDTASLPPALAERQRARRQILGIEWAQAFYGDEEAQLTEQILRPVATVPGAAPPLIDRSLLDTAARQRLHEEEAAQAQWLTQLEATRHDVAGLQNAPHLSALQRDQAVRALIDERYAGSDRLRVRALLGL